MATPAVLSSRTLLGIRATTLTKSLVLPLSSSPEPSDVSSYVRERRVTKPPLLINSVLVPSASRRYKCTAVGCNKAYTKPSRLEEHERSHIGLRPHVCLACNKAFFRETHLRAHARGHLTIDQRPFRCAEPGCDKRFCTAQHLRRHEDLHKGVKPFECKEAGCAETFVKHHQLRAHNCAVHAPPGTKAYCCTHDGCTSSFATAQKLRAHAKTHDENRYTCVHINCTPPPSSPRVYYPTWTALQHHVRTAHPPTCHRHKSPRIFTTQKGLKAHMKICVDDDAGDTESGAKRKRRREDEGGDWACSVDGCEKVFQSKKACTIHNSVIHLGLRPFACPHAECNGRAFGYKHLLGRHLVRAHAEVGSSHNAGVDDSNDDSDESESAEDPSQVTLDITTITGSAYAVRALQQLHRTPRVLQCPYPNSEGLLAAATAAPDGTPQCTYVFTRAYDLRRHLKTEHAVEVAREQADEWVGVQRTVTE